MILSNKERVLINSTKVVIMKVSNLINERGNRVTNQFVIEKENSIAFQSYDSMVCEIRPASMDFEKVVVFGKNWDYSRTTMRHLNNFLKQNNLDFLAGAKNIREALERGYARRNESIAVWLDETL